MYSRPLGTPFLSLIASSPSASARSIAASGRIEMRAIAQHG